MKSNMVTERYTTGLITTGRDELHNTLGVTVWATTGSFLQFNTHHIGIIPENNISLWSSHEVTMLRSARQRRSLYSTWNLPTYLPPRRESLVKMWLHTVPQGRINCGFICEIIAGDAVDQRVNIMWSPSYDGDVSSIKKIC